MPSFSTLRRILFVALTCLSLSATAQTANWASITELMRATGGVLRVKVPAPADANDTKALDNAARDIRDRFAAHGMQLQSLTLEDQSDGHVLKTFSAASLAALEEAAQ